MVSIAQGYIAGRQARQGMDLAQRKDQRDTRLADLAFREFETEQKAGRQKKLDEADALKMSTIGSMLAMAAQLPDAKQRGEMLAAGFNQMQQSPQFQFGENDILGIREVITPYIDNPNALRGLATAMGAEVDLPESGFSNVGAYDGPQGQGVYGVQGGQFRQIPGSEGATPVRPPSTTVSVNTEGPAVNVDEEATKALGRARGDRAGERLAAADQAFQMNMQLATISEALSGGAETGAGEETLLGLRSLASSFMPGFYSEQDLAQMGQQELIRAVGNQMALRLRNPDSGLGLPGAASNRDIQLLQSLVPGLALTEEGNQQLIGVLRAINDFKIALADEQERIIDENDGSVPKNLESQLRKFSQGYELFEVGDRISLYLAAGRQVEFGDDGAYLLKEGGDPSNANDWERIGG